MEESKAAKMKIEKRITGKTSDIIPLAMVVSLLLIELGSALVAIHVYAFGIEYKELPDFF